MSKINFGGIPREWEKPAKDPGKRYKVVADTRTQPSFPEVAVNSTPASGAEMDLEVATERGKEETSDDLQTNIFGFVELETKLKQKEEWVGGKDRGWPAQTTL